MPTPANKPTINETLVLMEKYFGIYMCCEWDFIREDCEEEPELNDMVLALGEVFVRHAYTPLYRDPQSRGPS